MPLMTGTVFLFAEIFTFALPVSLLIAFATFFYRQARRVTENGAAAGGTISAAAAVNTGGAPGAVGAGQAGGAGDTGGVAPAAPTTSGEQPATSSDPYPGPPNVGN